MRRSTVQFLPFGLCSLVLAYTKIATHKQHTHFLIHPAKSLPRIGPPSPTIWRYQSQVLAVAFLTSKILGGKEALTFYLDRCYHLALCIWLILCHYIVVDGTLLKDYQTSFKA